MKWQWLLIGALFGSFLVGSVAEGFVLRGAARLPPDVRERIFQREARRGGWWRLFETLGILLLCFGILRILRIVVFTPAAVGYYAMVSGIVLICLHKTLLSWATCRAYAAENAAATARRSAFIAALLVTIVEAVLAGVVCWFVLPRIPPIRSRKAGPTSPPGAGVPGTVGGAGGAGRAGRAGGVEERIWIPEAEALRIIGRDKAYFDKLVRWADDVRTRSVGGERFYRRVDITTLKEAGLPGVKELEEGLGGAPGKPPEPKPKSRSGEKKRAPPGGEALRE